MVFASILICICRLHRGRYFCRYHVRVTRWNLRPEILYQWPHRHFREASYVASAMTTALILIMNTIYQTVAKKLTDHENHRTDKQYEDALSAKIFVFQFLNSYASFFFIAFVAPFISPSPNNLKNFPGQYGAETCMQPLAINLGIIFGMRLWHDIEYVCMYVWADPHPLFPGRGSRGRAWGLNALFLSYCERP